MDPRGASAQGQAGGGLDRTGHPPQSSAMSSPARGGEPLPPAAVGLMLLLCASWGLNMVAVKIGNTGIPPVLQAGLRSLVGALLLGAWCRWRGISLDGWRRDGTMPAGLLAGLLFGLEFVLIYVGLGFTSASRAVVFVYGAPFFVALGVHWLLPDDRLTGGKALGLAIAFGGLALAFADGFARPGNARMLLGDALCLLAGAFWGMTTVLVKVSSLRTARPELVLQYQLAVSALLLIPVAPWLDASLMLRPTPLVVAAFLYQAVGVAFISYTAWFWLVSRHSASRLAAFSFLSPLFGVLAGTVLLREPLGPLFLLAAGLVAVGIWQVNRP